MGKASEYLGLVLFVLAVLHTFSTRYFEHRAHHSPQHSGLWHLLGEVEVVFGFWAMLLFAGLLILEGGTVAVDYIDTRNYTEPLFVFAIMTVAATRPILTAANRAVLWLGRGLPLAGSAGSYLVVMACIPLLGSFITEPAAMTLAALVLAEHFFARGLSNRFKYATLGVLFVNISIGGTLTHFAAPPVLMVAATWNWDITFMLSQFGWKAACAVLLNALLVTAVFRQELSRLAYAATEGDHQESPDDPLPAPTHRVPIPWGMTFLHLLFLASIVISAHHPAIFMGFFLLFLGVVHAYPQFQQRLILKESLLVAFFLAGLVVLGGLQQWWLQPLLLSLKSEMAFLGAIGLTALTDNAALTYLGSLVQGLTDDFKYALVAGAVTGGGLTIIANAPNPAGVAILKRYFDDEAVSPLQMLLASLLPTLIAALAFWFL